MQETLISCEQRRVLFALSDVTIAHAFASILASRGHDCDTAHSHDEALEKASCDVLVAELGNASACDSRCDGLELLARLKNSTRRPYTILIADGATADDYRQAILLGVDDIVERPLLPDDLASAVEASPASHVARRGTDTPTALMITLVALPGAAEAAARDTLGWCTRCEVTPPSRARIGSAIAEIVQNAVDHGAETVEVSATIDGRSLEVEIVDDGPGFDAVRTLTEGGLARAQALSEELVVRSEEGQGTSVWMRFGVTTLELESDEQIDLTDLDFFVPATSKELLTTLSEEPDAPVILSPALAVVVGRLLVGPDPRRVLQAAFRS